MPRSAHRFYRMRLTDSATQWTVRKRRIVSVSRSVIMLLRQNLTTVTSACRYISFFGIQSWDYNKLTTREKKLQRLIRRVYYHDLCRL